ncbi:unnamed protein product [Bursaphelenchus xylophilus]|uniref:(pine wood nematode) hypothetical protein n=1 Tax=Bursaphelenchus xylophilus TaxID=6326 RepID=A0A1I7SBY1_BURXY|nr:unnamed protein product [Bursaphelenchus xylophilus]CAG9089078.1 unnamed protein product [Bursaphelenchus xylophilus]
MSDTTEFETQTSDTTLVSLIKLDAGEVANFLKTVNFGEFFTLVFTKDGVRVVSDDGIDEQGNFYFLADFFDSFELKRPDVRVRVHSKKLINAHQIFGQKTSYDLRWILESKDDDLSIMLRSDSLLAKQAVATYELVQLQDTKEVEPEDTIVHVEFRDSNFLREIIQNLDNTASMVEFDFRTSKIMIKSTSTVHQKTSIRFCQENADKLQLITLAEGGVRVFYRMDHIRHLVQFLKVTNRVSVLINEDGVLSLQGRLDTFAAVMYLQFFVNRFIPDEGEEDPDEGRIKLREMPQEVKQERDEDEVVVVNERLALRTTENPIADPAIREFFDRIHLR